MQLILSQESFLKPLLCIRKCYKNEQRVVAGAFQWVQGFSGVLGSLKSTSEDFSKVSGDLRGSLRDLRGDSVSQGRFRESKRV